MSRITEILKQKKLQGLNWDDLSDHLPITSAGLRAAFSRGSVSEIYLDVLEKVLKIQTERKELLPVDHDNVKEPESSIYSSIRNIVKEIVYNETRSMKDEIDMIRQDINMLFQDYLKKEEKKMSEESGQSSRKTS